MGQGTRPDHITGDTITSLCKLNRTCGEVHAKVRERAPTDRQLKKSRGTLSKRSYKEKQKLTRHAIAKDNEHMEYQPQPTQALFFHCEQTTTSCMPLQSNKVQLKRSKRHYCLLKMYINNSNSLRNVYCLKCCTSRVVDYKAVAKRENDKSLKVAKVSSFQRHLPNTSELEEQHGAIPR